MHPPRFQHQRHKPAIPLERPRALIVAVPAMQSQVNLSRIVRAAGCCGVTQVLAEGTARVDPKIARDALEAVEVNVHRSLIPKIERFAEEGYHVVGLEQTTQSVALYDFKFERRSLLLVGHERQGLTDKWLAHCESVVEIPVYGQPHSFNAATAAAIAMYEYCRQWPQG